MVHSIIGLLSISECKQSEHLQWHKSVVQTYLNAWIIYQTECESWMNNIHLDILLKIAYSVVYKVALVLQCSLNFRLSGFLKFLLKCIRKVACVRWQYNLECYSPFSHHNITFDNTCLLPYASTNYIASRFYSIKSVGSSRGLSDNPCESRIKILPQIRKCY